MNGHKCGPETLQWKLGLVNCHNKYLTAETFSNKINASGTTLRKKQLWVLEHDSSAEDVVYIKSHLNRYLAGDKKGNVTAGSEQKGEEEQFRIVYHPKGDGRWAFQNVKSGYYFGGTDDNLLCYEKGPTDTEWWTARLAVHPQVNIRSVARTRYARMENDEIHFNELIPWGQDALITIEFKDGKYGVKTCDNRYLHREGNLVNAPGPDTLFTLEIRSGQYSGMSLKDCTGKYLTAVGTYGTMQSRAKSAKKDIVFTLEDSHPQAFITAFNNKNVSIKQGKLSVIVVFTSWHLQ